MVPTQTLFFTPKNIHYFIFQLHTTIRPNTDTAANIQTLTLFYTFNHRHKAYVQTRTLLYTSKHNAYINTQTLLNTPKYKQYYIRPNTYTSAYVQTETLLHTSRHIHCCIRPDTCTAAYVQMQTLCIRPNTSYLQTQIFVHAFRNKH